MKLTMTLPDHTEDEAKELAEETFGAMMWIRREDGALVAYPNDNEHPVVIESNTNVQRRSGDEPASPSVQQPNDQPPAPERSL